MVNKNNLNQDKYSYKNIATVVVSFMVLSFVFTGLYLAILSKSNTKAFDLSEMVDDVTEVADDSSISLVREGNMYCISFNDRVPELIERIETLEGNIDLLNDLLNRCSEGSSYGNK